jgi:hypothetical protein
MKIKDLSPKMRISSADKELRLEPAVSEMGGRQGGLSMFSNVFKRGYGDAVFGSDKNGIWLGKADFTGAPFRVDMDGNVFASSATIGGAISVFKQDAIPTSLSEGDIWFDTDDDNKVYRAASVGADQIAVGEWEAVDDQRAADALLQSTNTTLGAIVTVGSGSGFVRIDGGNNRILVNDGTSNRIVIGNV